MSQFFVMMETQKGEKILPLVDDSGDPCLFDSEADARNCAHENPYCIAFGFVIYERGDGFGG